MRGENARLGVETTTRRDRTARSAIKSRSTLSIDQWRTARPERNRLEKIQLGGPRMGSSSQTPRLKFRLDKKKGQRHCGSNFPTGFGYLVLGKFREVVVVNRTDIPRQHSSMFAPEQREEPKQ